MSEVHYMVVELQAEDFLQFFFFFKGVGCLIFFLSLSLSGTAPCKSIEGTSDKSLLL